MGKIQVLDKHTIDKIAAGEVVDRPASVVKELVENAIDAGSTAITVEIIKGGKELIRVTDNGCGIEADDIKTAFLRHATSKITKVEDLAYISSLGFRGEALSSIGAVAKVEVITKTLDSIVGTRYVFHGGKEISMEEIGAPEGTTFLIANLFFNTPGRQKFLKSDISEAGAISSLMEQLALSHPNIAFNFIQNKQVKLHTSGNNELKDVIYQIYGREITKSLLEVEYEKDGISISGFIGKPTIARGNRNFESYYVNGRYVKNKYITTAIEEAYKGFLMQHKFPFVALAIEVSGPDVDVNVHPRKMEVRFSNGNKIYEAIFYKLKSVLANRDLIPKVPVAEVKKAKDIIARSSIPEPFEKRNFDVKNALSSSEEQLFRGSLELRAEKKDDIIPEQEIKADSSFSFESKYANASTTLSNNIEKPSFIKAIEEKEKPKVVMEEKTYNKQENLGFDLSKMAEKETKLPENNIIIENTTKSVASNKAKENVNIVKDSILIKDEKKIDIKEQIEIDATKLLSKEARRKHKIIGQIFDTYWIIQYKDSIYIVDQHAACEKVNYEKFLTQFNNNTIEPQLIYPPIIIKLNNEEERIIMEHKEEFKEAGFSIENYGDGEYCVNEVPSTLMGLDSKDVFITMLDGLVSGRNNTEELFTHKLATMACKASVKGNSKLSVDEINRLLDDLLDLENPYNCPHGRPVIIEMTKEDIEKKFKRIV